MANIKEFDAGSLQIRPSETGVEAQAMAARRVGTFYNQAGSAEDLLARETERLAGQTQQLGRETGDLGDFKGREIAQTGARLGSAVQSAGDAGVKYVEHQEMTQGAAAYAALVQRKTDEWNAIQRDPSFNANDPTVVPQFMAGLENDLQSFKNNGFLTENGQKFAEAHVDALRLHLAEKVHADISRDAAVQVEANLRSTVNSLSANAHADPSSLDFSLASLKSAITGAVSTSPTLTGPESVKARTELLQKYSEEVVKSAVIGSIAQTGRVPALVNDPKYSPFLNGPEVKQWEMYAQGIRRMNQAEARSQRAEAEHNARTDFNNKANQIEMSTIPQNAGDPVTMPADYWQNVKKLADHPGVGLEPGRLKSLVDNGEKITERMNKPEPLGRISHDTTMQIINDIRSGKITDTGPIYDRMKDLNRADFKFAIDEFNNLKTPEGAALGKDREEFFKRYAASVDGAMDFGGHSALGSQRMYEFEMAARRQEADLRRQGKDPHSLYDPESQGFLGKQVPKYHVTLQQSMAYEKTIRGAEADKAKITPVPPPAQRTVGKVYDLPDGSKGKWNGRAWETP